MATDSQDSQKSTTKEKTTKAAETTTASKETATAATATKAAAAAASGPGVQSLIWLGPPIRRTGLSIRRAQTFRGEAGVPEQFRELLAADPVAARLLVPVGQAGPVRAQLKAGGTAPRGPGLCPNRREVQALGAGPGRG